MQTDLLRKKTPQIRTIDSIDLPNPTHFQLDNGVETWCINSGEQPVLKIDLIFKAGSIFGKNPLTSQITNLCLREGTKSYSSEQIAEIFDSCGASLNMHSNRDDARITLFCLTKHLNTLMPVLAEVVLSPIFPENEIKTVAENARQDFLVEMQKVKFISRRNFGRLVFGNDHIYSRYEDVVDYENINREDLLGFYQQFYESARFRIIASGKIPNDIRQTINKHFGKHRVLKQNPRPEGTVEPSQAKGVHFFEKADSLQSGLNIGKILFNLRHSDYNRMKVVSTILGGYFGSRLMANIREDKGFTYGIHSMTTSSQHAGLFHISTQVGTEVTQAALEEILKEIELLRSAQVKKSELELVKNYMSGLLQQQADGPFAQGEMLKTMLDYQLDFSYYKKYLETIKTVTIEEIQDLAVKYLDPNTMLSVVVGSNNKR